MEEDDADGGTKKTVQRENGAEDSLTDELTDVDEVLKEYGLPVTSKVGDPKEVSAVKLTKQNEDTKKVKIDSDEEGLVIARKKKRANQKAADRLLSALVRVRENHLREKEDKRELRKRLKTPFALQKLKVEELKKEMEKNRKFRLERRSFQERFGLLDEKADRGEEDSEPALDSPGVVDEDADLLGRVEAQEMYLESEGAARKTIPYMADAIDTAYQKMSATESELKRGYSRLSKEKMQELASGQAQTAPGTEYLVPDVDGTMTKAVKERRQHKDFGETDFWYKVDGKQYRLRLAPAPDEWSIEEKEAHYENNKRLSEIVMRLQAREKARNAKRKVILEAMIERHMDALTKDHSPEEKQDYIDEHEKGVALWANEFLNHLEELARKNDPLLGVFENIGVTDLTQYLRDWTVKKMVPSRAKTGSVEFSHEVARTLGEFITSPDSKKESEEALAWAKESRDIAELQEDLENNLQGMLILNCFSNSDNCIVQNIVNCYWFFENHILENAIVRI